LSRKHFFFLGAPFSFFFFYLQALPLSSTAGQAVEGNVTVVGKGAVA